MKFICVGKNYADHAAEMSSAVPTSPLIFLKPQTAFLANGQTFYIPDFSEDIHYEAELIFRISKPAKGLLVEEALGYIDAISVGIDFTARDIQAECKKKGYPWELAKSFDFSAVIGEWQPFDPIMASTAKFHLDIDNKRVQSGDATNMIFNLPYIMHYVSQRFTLNKGDVIFSGTPSGVGQVTPGNILQGYLNDNNVMTCHIK